MNFVLQLLDSPMSDSKLRVCEPILQDTSTLSDMLNSII